MTGTASPAKPLPGMPSGTPRLHDTAPRALAGSRSRTSTSATAPSAIWTSTTTSTAASSRPCVTAATPVQPCRHRSRAAGVCRWTITAITARPLPLRAVTLGRA
jgi:hypothetical protein